MVQIIIGFALCILLFTFSLSQTFHLPLGLTEFYQLDTVHSYLSHEPISRLHCSLMKQGQFTLQVRLMRLGFLICFWMRAGPSRICCITYGDSGTVWSCSKLQVLPLLQVWQVSICWKQSLHTIWGLVPNV